MSAILLLEHCGLQISVRGLSVDDKQVLLSSLPSIGSLIVECFSRFRHECLSLIRRLHYANFKHNSIFERNILIQNGPLQYPPWKRSALHRRFRLIDFGRTRKLDQKKTFHECTEEVRYATSNLELAFPQMGYEFGA